MGVAFAVALWASGAAAGPLADALLTNPNFKVRLKAATELGRAQDPQGVAALLRALEDEHGLVRAAAVSSLGQLQTREAIPMVCKLRDDPDAFVARKAGETLDLFGGPTACNPTKIFVEIEVVGADQNLRRFAETQILQRAANDTRVVLGPTLSGASGAQIGADPRSEVTAGRMPGVALSLNLQTTVNRLAGSTRIQCQLGQTVYLLRKERVLKGSATQRAEIDLGSSSVTEQAINGQLQDCVSALVPVVYEGFGDYLKGVK